MIKKLIVILITTFTLTLNVNASSDGELLLKKNEPAEVKDCFEGFNRASFALNQGLDKVIFKPVASVYRGLPSPVKTGGAKQGGTPVKTGGDAEDKGRPAPKAEAMGKFANSPGQEKHLPAGEAKADTKDGTDASAKSPISGK